MIDYKVHFHGQAIKELRRLSQKNKKIVNRIFVRLEELCQNTLIGKPLKGPLKGSNRIRIGDYRVVYDIIDKDKVILVWKIQHRREVYR